MEKKLNSPAVGRYLKERMDIQNVWHALDKSGTKGRMTMPSGITVEYEYDTNDKTVKARAIVDWLAESKVLSDAKLARDAETTGKSEYGINGGMYSLTPYLDMELKARGLDAFEWDDMDQQKKVWSVIEQDFPLYKTTNRKLT